MQLEGQIGEIDVIERLVELWHERFTGAFRFEQDGVIKIIYFKTGDVLSASTNDRADSIDEILLRAGKITREHIKQALAKRKENETLGDALLNLGFITRKELTWARRVQVIGIVRSIRGWDNGSYTGVADYLPKREEGTLFPMPQILLELIVTDTDRSKFEKAMEGGAAVFTRSADFSDAYPKLGLNQDADDIVNEIDGFKTAADIVASSGKDAFNVYKLLEAFRILGLVQRIERSPGTAEVSFDDFAAAGVADASDAWSSNHGSGSDAPHFELDDTPPVMTPPAVTPPPPEPVPPPEPEPEWSAPPVWQPEPEMETPRHADVPLAAPAPAPPLQPEEPQWGFDEAQIETARRAAVPVRGSEPVPPPIPPPKMKKTKSGGASRLLFPLIWIVVVAASAYAGWWYWNSRQAAQPVPQAVKRPAKKPAIPVTPPPVVASTVTMATTTTMTQAPPVTATTASATPPPHAPMRVTATAAAAPPVTHLERTSNGATTITNTTTAATSARAPSSDPLRAKYDAMAKEASANTSRAYTVQFELVCETASVTRALRDGGSSVWLSAAPHKGRNCYRVFWGRYATQQEASAAIASIPASLREGSKATVVKIPR